MADIPEDKVRDALTKVEALLQAVVPQPKTLAAILQITDANKMCVEYCQYAQPRLYEPDKHQISHYEVVANLVDRFHYYLVCGSLLSVLEHESEFPDFIAALEEVGATQSAKAMRALFRLIAKVPEATLAKCSTLGEFTTAIGERDFDRLADEIEPEESWCALVEYLNANRSRLTHTD